MSATKSEPAEKLLSLQQGKYVFIDDLQQIQLPESVVPVLAAKAIYIIEKEGSLTGDIALVNLSDLILKQSTYIDEHGKAIEAHKLYTWPRNLGSTEEWTAAKAEFLNQYVLNFPLEIVSLQPDHAVTWKYITPENFKKIPDNIQASASFQEYAVQKAQYFFLRRPFHEPQ